MQADIPSLLTSDTVQDTVMPDATPEVSSVAIFAYVLETVWEIAELPLPDDLSLLSREILEDIVRKVHATANDAFNEVMDHLHQEAACSGNS